jgi:hypothetical protein
MDCPDVCLEALWLQEWEWVLEDCHKRSCWKNSIGVCVPRPCGSDVYVYSKSCRLCLTVVYWLLECNKVPSRIEPTSTLQYINDNFYTNDIWKIITVLHNIYRHELLWALNRHYCLLCQRGPNIFFPPDKNSFPVGPKGQRNTSKKYFWKLIAYVLYL